MVTAAAVAAAVVNNPTALKKSVIAVTSAPASTSALKVCFLYWG